MVLAAGGPVCPERGGLLADGLRSGKAPGHPSAGGTEPVAAGKRRYAGGHVPVYGPQLPGTAFFCVSEVRKKDCTRSRKLV